MTYPIVTIKRAVYAKHGVSEMDREYNITSIEEQGEIGWSGFSPVGTLTEIIEYVQKTLKLSLFTLDVKDHLDGNKKIRIGHISKV
jgi:hypothetical protein